MRNENLQCLLLNKGSSKSLMCLIILIIVATSGYAQEKIISGKVTGSKGLPLPSVTVREKGTNNGVMTDFDGNYRIQVSSPESVLVFTYVGMIPVERTVDENSIINVEMEVGSQALEEVVLVGYGTQKKVNVTGAISEIDSEQIENRAANTATQILQGLAPNLNIDASNSGGQSDGRMNLNIRGTGSLSSSAPLILVNGVRTTQDEFATLNPNIIENISVLKDAAASAIYGAQAAYGVILVETKKGNENQNFSIKLSSNLRAEQPIFVPESVNSLTYAKVANDASMNTNGQVLFDEEQIALMESVLEGSNPYGTMQDPDNPNQWIGIGGGSAAAWLDGFANTDWYDVMYKDYGFSQKHDISVTGGGEKINYYLSGSILEDEGQFKYGDDKENFTRYNFNSRVSADITEWLTVSNIIRYSRVDNIFPASLQGDGRGRIFHDIMRFPPLVPYRTPPVEDNEGNIIVPEQLAGIAAFNENNGFDKYRTDNLVATFKAKLNLTKDLVLQGDYTFKTTRRDRTFHFKKWSFLGPDGEPSITYQTNNNQILKDWRKEYYSSMNIYANYSKSINDHNINILTGYQQEENYYERLQVGKNEVLAPRLNTLNAAVGEIIGPANPMSHWATLGVFGRLAYNYKEKYLLEFNGRYDGSSKFAKGNRFGFFPSLALGYNIHKEKFWDPLSNTINRMKIRASWGRLGNQNVANNLYASSIPIRRQLPWITGGERPNYSGIPRIVSPNITWETAETLNFGVDLGFFQNRLSTSFDIYERQTDNMFGPLSALPAVLGTSPPRTNSTSLSTKGWELELGWRDAINDFKYNFTLMLSDNQSTITKYHNPEKVLNNLYEGEVLGSIWGFEADDLFQSQEEVDEYLSEVDLSAFGTGWQPGNVKYKDLNGDGVVNSGENTLSNSGDKRIIGSSHPRYRYSIQAGASWKNFDFNMMWQGIGKRDVWLPNYATVFWGWQEIAHSRITEPSLDYWSESNPDAYLPIPLNNRGRAGSRKDRYPSTRYLQNGAYVRLKTLNFGYTLPSSFIQNLKMDNARIYFTGENLLTITEMWPTIDPEIAVTGNRARTGYGRAYPLSRVFSLGLDITF